jgi:hypothetical protein
VVDLATVGIALDATKVEEGEKVVARSFANIEGASERMTATVQKGADAMAQAAQAQQRLAAASSLRAEMEQKLARGEQVKTSTFFDLKRIEKNLIEEVAAAREAAWAKGSVLATAETAAHAENATRVAAAAAAKRQAVSASNQLNRALTTLSLSAAGIPGPIGRVVSAFGSLAAGGAVTVGVLAGVALISAAYEKLTGETRRVKEETDKLIESLLKRYNLEQGVTAQENQANLRARLAADEARIAAERRGRFVSQGGAAPQLIIDEAAIQKAIEKRGETLKAIAQQERDRELERQGIAKSRADFEKQQASEAERRAEAARRDATALRDLQLDAATTIARAHTDTARVIQLEYEQTVNGLRESFGRLGQAVPKELLQLLDVQRRADLIGAALTPRVVGQGTPFGGLQLRGIDGVKTPQELVDANAAIRERDIQEAQRSYEAALRTTSDAFQRGFAGIFDNGLEGFSQFFASVEDLAKQAAASIAATMTIKALGIDQLLKDITSGATTFGGIGKGFEGPGSGKANALAGFAAGSIGAGIGQDIGGDGAGGVFGSTLGGAAAGFAAGGPIGAIVGGVTGIVSGLAGLGSKAEAIQREYDRVNNQFAESLDEFLKSTSGFYDGFTGEQRRLAKQFEDTQAEAVKIFRGSPLGREIRDRFGVDLGVLNKIFREEGVDGIKALRDGLEGVVGSTEDIDVLIARLEELGEAGQAALQDLLEQQALLLAQVSEDLEVRALRAQGRNAEADAAAFANEQLRERLRLEEEFGDAFDESMRTQLEYTQGLEAEARAREKLANQLRFNAGLDVRQLELDGKTEEAAVLREAIAAQEEYNQAVREGMDAASLARLAIIQQAEAEKAAADRARTREQEDFDFRMGLIRRRAELEGDEEAIRYVRAAELQRQQDAEIEAAQKLLDAGRITQEEFDRFIDILGDEFVAAMDEAAIAAAEAAEKMRQAVASLNQEFDVFQTSLEQQVKQTGDLFGFTGKSIDQLLEMFTTTAEAGPGGITPEQQALNDQIQTYVNLLRRAEAESAEVEQPAARARVGSNGTVIQGNVVLQIEIRVDSDDLRDTERLAERVAARINREFGGRASLLKGASGRA